MRVCWLVSHAGYFLVDSNTVTVSYCAHERYDDGRVVGRAIGARSESLVSGASDHPCQWPGWRTDHRTKHPLLPHPRAGGGAGLGWARLQSPASVAIDRHSIAPSPRAAAKSDSRPAVWANAGGVGG